MLMLKVACLIVTGIASGLVTATGLFALISSIGLINRYADVTNTKEHILLYEEMIIAGAGIGNIWFVFELPCHTGIAGLLIYGFVSGIFIWNILIMSCRNSKSTSNTYAPGVHKKRNRLYYYVYCSWKMCWTSDILSFSLCIRDDIGGLYILCLIEKNCLKGR